MLKGKTPLIIALVLGLLACVVAYSAIKKKQADVSKGWKLVPVLVAAVNIPAGKEITEDLIRTRAVPEQFVTSSIVSPEMASSVIGNKVMVTLQAGDPLLWTQFETTKGAERLSTKVQRKTRAITIEANKTAAVGGWVRPNDRVDVLGSFKDPQTNESVAVTLLQNVIVIATGKITGTTNVNLVPEGQREYSNVTLMVMPEEAEILALAGELGSLTLSLRSEDDIDVIEERGRATINTLLSGERTRVLQKKRAETIQMIRGAGESKSGVTP